MCSLNLEYIFYILKQGLITKNLTIQTTVVEGHGILRDTLFNNQIFSKYLTALKKRTKHRTQTRRRIIVIMIFRVK
jgi:hypothetical protein